MNFPLPVLERLTQPLPPDPPDPNPQPLGPITSATPSAGALELETAEAAVTLRLLADRVVEVRVRGSGDFDLPSFCRLDEPELRPPSYVRCEAGSGLWHLRTPDLSVDIEPEPLRIAVRSATGHVVVRDDPARGVARTACGWRAHWVLEPGTRIYGLGAKTGPLDRRGRRTLLWARDMFVGPNSDPLYSAIPFFLLHREGRWVGVLLDSAARSVFDFGATAPGRMEFGPAAGAFVCVIFCGPSLREVLCDYTALTGRPALPPLWALGHHQSRYSYADAEEVRAIAAEFRERDIPTDAIHLDIHYMDGFRVFTFHPRRFPDPAGLASDLAGQGFRLVAIVDPGIKVDADSAVYREALERGYFATDRAGKTFTMKVWPGDAAFPDFFRTEVRRWWGDQHRVYAEAGIEGIWNDMNEPSGWSCAVYIGDAVLPLGEKSTAELTHKLDDGRVVPHHAVHNAYAHLENRAAYEGWLRQRPEERPFLLTRAAFAGTQRYAAQWTGDVLSTWEALAQSLPMLMGLGLSGATFCGCDIGGFVNDCSAELYARWIEIGALYPFCRTHTALHTRRQEPWSFGRRVEAVARKYLKLRYRLLPYLYTCFWEASQCGMPVWRPVFAEFPADDRLFSVEHQVLVGPALLAAPVLKPGVTSRRVLLPAGQWWDWEQQRWIAGGGEVEVPAPLEILPLFARGGTAIPTQGDVCWTGDRPGAAIVWEVFLPQPTTADLGMLYEDDGATFRYRKGEWRLTRVRAEARSDGCALRFGPASGGFESPRATARVHLRSAALQIERVDGEPVGGQPEVELPHDGREHVLELARRPVPGSP